MSSAMIHIQSAYKYNGGAGPLFFIGNLAPDFHDEKEFKDRTHFRSSADRRGDLLRLLEGTPANDEYLNGILMHLFLDYKWDNMIADTYRDTFFSSGEFLFRPYREQIHLASKRIFNSWTDADNIFKKMLSVPVSNYGTHPEFKADGVYKYVKAVYETHKNTSDSSCTAFSVEFVENFTDKTAAEFKDFREKGIII